MLVIKSSDSGSVQLLSTVHTMSESTYIGLWL